MRGVLGTENTGSIAWIDWSAKISGSGLIDLSTVLNQLNKTILTHRRVIKRFRFGRHASEESDRVALRLFFLRETPRYARIWLRHVLLPILS